jgi:WXXGXW repeat (2 copies)
MVTVRRLIPFALAAGLAAALPLAAPPAVAQVAIGVSVTVAPPPLPLYAQPVIPGPGYVWVPGYWAWGPYGYYWVPGTWVQPPAPGLLWTPGYWAWLNGAYVWHAGYWAPHVGFYGGIDYGFGYPGTGYYGGHWDHGRFFYNRSVTNIGSRHIATVYDNPVPTVRAGARASFAGGHGGTEARPTAAEETVTHEHHYGASPLQAQHEHAAAGQRTLRATVNHGHPAMAATERPGHFGGERPAPHAAPETAPRPPQPAHEPRAPQHGGEREPHPQAERGHEPPQARAQHAEAGGREHHEHDHP